MSNETKWTPGPWEIDEYGRVTADASGCPLNTVGVAGFCLTTSDEADANTRLAAAAPEMYILLEAAACPSCDGSGAFYQGDGDVTQCQWCYERDAALAKARGEKP